MKTWFQIKNQKNKRAKILIYEQIGVDWFGDGVSAKDFNKELDALDVNDIDLHINSPGGNVFDGNSIYNALVDHKAKVHVKIDGIAASIASVIAMAGDDVEMPKNAMLMIHDPSGFVVGTSQDMKKMADALDKIKGGLVSAYTRRAKKTEDEISDMMTDETWLTAEEAFDFGFADKITESVKISANFRGLSNFKNVPDCLKISNSSTINLNPESPSGEMEGKDMEITLELIQSKHPEIIVAILKAADIQQVGDANPELFKTLLSDGAKAENDRIKAVKEQLIPGHEKLINDLMFDGQTTGEQAAVRVLKAEKDLRSKTLENHQTDSPEKIVQVENQDELEASTVASGGEPTEDECKKKWDKDSKLRAEFGNNFENYFHYAVAEANKQVKVLGSKQK